MRSLKQKYKKSLLASRYYANRNSTELTPCTPDLEKESQGVFSPRYTVNDDSVEDRVRISKFSSYKNTLRFLVDLNSDNTLDEYECNRGLRVVNNEIIRRVQNGYDDVPAGVVGEMRGVFNECSLSVYRETYSHVRAREYSVDEMKFLVRYVFEVLNLKKKTREVWRVDFNKVDHSVVLYETIQEVFSKMNSKDSHLVIQKIADIEMSLGRNFMLGALNVFKVNDNNITFNSSYYQSMITPELLPEVFAYRKFFDSKPRDVIVRMSDKTPDNNCEWVLSRNNNTWVFTVGSRENVVEMILDSSCDNQELINNLFQEKNVNDSISEELSFFLNEFILVMEKEIIKYDKAMNDKLVHGLKVKFPSYSPILFEEAAQVRDNDGSLLCYEGKNIAIVPVIEQRPWYGSIEEEEDYTHYTSADEENIPLPEEWTGSIDEE